MIHIESGRMISGDVEVEFANKNGKYSRIAFNPIDWPEIKQLFQTIKVPKYVIADIEKTIAFQSGR